MKLDLQKFIEVKLLHDKYISQNKYLEFYNLEQESKTYGDSLSLLSDQLYWEKAEDYLKLVDLFVNTEMTVEEFRTQFYDLRVSIDNHFDQLMEQLKHEVQFGQLTLTEMEINPRSKRFRRVIDEYIFYVVELYDPDVTLKDNLENPDLMYIAMSGPMVKSMIKENIKPKLESYHDGKLQKKYKREGKWRELLELEKNYKKSSRSLSLFWNQIYWERAEDYLKLVDLFVNTEMTVEEFRTQFYDLRESAEAYYKQLIEQLKSTVQSEQLSINKMEINPKSKRFIKIIDEPIFDLLESYNPDIILEEGRANPNLISIELSGFVLKSRIKKNIKLKLENYCAGKLRS